MSNEVKTKEKVDMDPKYIIKLTVTLFVTCVIVAGLLGLVNSVTEGPIAEKNKTKTAAAIQEVLPEMEGSPAVVELTDEMTAAASSAGATITEAYEAQAGGSVIGYALKIVASGSQGNIEMMVGVDAEGAVTGVSIVKNSETSGIGSKVMSNENGVLDQFIGKSAADGTLSVGKNVDAISGATVSSRGVTTGVNAALAVAGVMG
ncbi:MAG: RnfABCDGE type electron transport complex subunit G [Clostridiales bacterium]|nr:RnfABCDGE type electron transport complex subunit G [Clostridiales bacterium]